MFFSSISTKYLIFNILNIYQTKILLLPQLRLYPWFNMKDWFLVYKRYISYKRIRKARMSSLPNIGLNWKRSSSLNKKNKELSEMESFRNLGKNHFENPLMGYLNINSLGNKIIDLINTFNRCEPLYNFISRR